LPVTALGAGYADHLGAEKKTGRLLQDANKALTAPRASVHLNLRSLIRGLLVKCRRSPAE
jgi:hypothetical protein